MPQVDHNDKQHAALEAFKQLWADKFAHDSLLVFSTGRSHALFKELQVLPSPPCALSVCLWLAQWLTSTQGEVPLGTPDVLVCSVGTEIFLEVSSPSPQPDDAWVKKLDQGWDRQGILDAAAKHSQLKLQVRPGSLLTPAILTAA